MKRVICPDCQRAKQTCYCELITPINNKVNVVVLQHPKEVGHTKGSLGLLARSLSHCEVLIGECFNENVQLQHLLTLYADHICLLFPHEHSQVLTVDALTIAETLESIEHQPGLNQTLRKYQCIVLLDATWKKAYKMYTQSSILHHISHVHLPPVFQGQYQIRKTNKENALSTLEACCHALTLMENNRDKYQVLLKNFVIFNQIQLSFRP